MPIINNIIVLVKILKIKFIDDIVKVLIDYSKLKLIHHYF